MSSPSSPKRRKLNQNRDEVLQYPDSLISEIEAELGVEIGLRKRLLDTLEARIAWAIALRENLNESEGNSGPETFRNVALDTLQLLDAQSNIILCHEPRSPFSGKVARPPPRKSIQFTNVKTKPSFLFIRSSSLPGSDMANSERDNHLYILKCPPCSKTSFISLQGLLNHARLVHNLEWGSHEQCITACATPDNDLDTSNGTEVGIGPAGILPGLRNIFQMAVSTRRLENERALVLPQRNFSTPTEAAALPAIPSLNETLGLHDETPALAMFLGKEPVRRQIKISEGGDVDIEGLTCRKDSSQRQWRMPFAHRHVDGLSLSNVEPQNKEDPISGLLNSPRGGKERSVSTIQTVSARSRFHTVSRVTITDRSLWISPENRPSEYQQYTHKWMISIDSPSYTYHITSILNSVEVTLSDNNAQTQVPLIPAVAATNPPFVVIGLASAPFLAKVTLAFAGPHPTTTTSDSSGPEQVFVFEHWIDLYPLPVSHVVKGQDQVVDIDLDKDTAIRAPDHRYPVIEAKSLLMQPFESSLARKVLPLTEPANPVSAYEEKLLDLSRHFPMTLEDFKGRRSKPPNVPYLLASSVRHYRGFITGRRKAIEWSRARAIHDAYTQSLLEASHPSDLIPLSVADIYSWLSENGHFPKATSDLASAQLDRSSANDREEATQPKTFCRFCGFDRKVHDKIVQFKQENSEGVMSNPFEEIKPEPLNVSLPTGVCTVVAPEFQITKFPRIDITQFSLPDKRASNRGLLTNLDISALLLTTVPSIAVQMHNLTKRWDLWTFHNPSEISAHHAGSPMATSMPSTSVTVPLEALGKSRKEVEARLAPHALLALLAQSFVKEVVCRGLEVANQNRSMALGFRRKGRDELNTLLAPRMLTPTHILSGILTRGLSTSKQRPLDVILPLSMSKLGIVLENAERDTAHTTSNSLQDGSLEIKVEE